MHKPLCLFIAFICACPCVAQVTSPQTLAYVLQAEELAKSRDAVVQILAQSDRDWIILDTHIYDAPWTQQELQTIRSAKPDRKVIAYLSIGEAETYREYWDKKWDTNEDGKPDDGAPGFLCEENPQWAGNYKVRYWHRDWQALILKRLNDILFTQKFDGLYLDIVDGFSYFEHDPKTNQWLDNRRNLQTGNTYRLDMIRWVQHIAQNARRINHKAIIVPQNGVQLLADTTYTQAIDAIGVEDLYSDGNKLQPASETEHRLDYLKPFIATGKPIWLIEYATHPRRQRHTTLQAKTLGMRLLLTDRALKTLGSCPTVNN